MVPGANPASAAQLWDRDEADPPTTAWAGVCPPTGREAWVRARGPNRIALQRGSTRRSRQKESLYQCLPDGIGLPRTPR